MKLWGVAKMPFADGNGLIALGSKNVRQGRLLERKPIGFTVDRRNIELVAKAILVSSCEQAGSSRAADGAAGVAVAKVHAVSSNRVNLWG